MLETSDFAHRSAMWSLSFVMSECSLSGRGQGHVSNFYIVDLETFATASRRYTGDIHNSTVVSLFMIHLRQWKRLGRVMVEYTLSITHCLRLNLQLHTIDLVRTCRISSFCSVAWQLARFQLTRHIARSLGDCWASCCDGRQSDFQGQKCSTLSCKFVAVLYTVIVIFMLELTEEDFEFNQHCYL